MLVLLSFKDDGILAVCGYSRCLLHDSAGSKPLLNPTMTTTCRVCKGVCLSVRMPAFMHGLMHACMYVRKRARKHIDLYLPARIQANLWVRM